MCGISGIVNTDGSVVSKNEIEQMNELISHRGPDGEGYYCYKNLALGHKRLSIIDLSERGKQPMHYLDELVITYNGEIYNYIELKDELKIKGYEFFSNSDTEVILASYHCWGQKCVEFFNGMWSFAIFDKKKNIIFCSRDRFGIKPFYYSQIDKKFVFGSEIKQILNFHSSNKLNKQILFDYLFMGFEEHSHETFFDNVFKLNPSHNLIYDLNIKEFQIIKFFELEINNRKGLKPEIYSINLNKLLTDSIELRLRSDVKVGTCLSGGLDSSAIANIASKIYSDQNNKKFLAIHSKSIEEENDESKYARLVSEISNIDLHEIEPSTTDIKNSVDEVIYAQEEPFGGPSIFMQYFVMKKSNNIGCKVLLDGQGGDEVLLGYERYHAFHLGVLLRKLKFKKYINYVLKLKTHKFSLISLLLISILTISPKLYLFFRKKMVSKESKPKERYSTKHLNKIINFSDLRKNQINEIMHLNLPQLLKYEDKNSMKNSIETRLPFLDYRLVSEIISVKPSIKLKSGFLKFLLRMILVGKLPDEFIWRTKKFAFEAPTNSWINENKSEMISEIKKSDIINSLVKLNHSFYKNHNLFWKLYNISVWERLYEVKLR
tara:strand:- start:562 stop:2373 length:1812 start_codon:yes stop_codon:yes gene_type:complete